MRRVFFVALCWWSVFNLNLFASGIPNEDCNKCVDQEGKSCDEQLRRFKNSRYWIYKGEQTVTFQEAVQTCIRNGFMLAEVLSEEDQGTFSTLASYSGLDQHWIGAIRGGPSGSWAWRTLDGLTRLPFKPSYLGGEAMGSPGETEVATVDSGGRWSVSSSPSDTAGIVCQFQWNSQCSTRRSRGEDAHHGVILEGRAGDTLVGRVNCPLPSGHGGQWVRIDPNSKFIVPQTYESKFFVTAEEATRWCFELGLEPAVINNAAQFAYFAAFQGSEYDRKKLTQGGGYQSYFRLGLGGDATGHSGIYYYPRTSTTLPFYAFYFVGLYIESPGADCLAFQCWSDSECHYKAIHCDTIVYPVCQFKRGTECYRQSTQGMQEAEEKDDLIKLTTSKNRIYYGGTKQKKFYDAEAFCKGKGMTLLTFIKGDDDETRFFKDEVMRLYSQAVGIPSFVQGVWSSGHYQGAYEKSKGINFITTGEFWTRAELESNWNIYDSKIENAAWEVCLKMITNQGKHWARPYICDTPAYFVCHEDVNKPTTTTTTTTEATTTTTTTTVKPGESGTSGGTGIPGGTGGPPNRCNGETTQILFQPGGLTTEETRELIKDILAYNFSKDYSEAIKIKKESQWRVPHVKEMGSLTKVICPKEYVAAEFVNMLMNLIMVYYNSMEELGGRPPQSYTLWSRMEKLYGKCENASEPLEFTAVGGFITTFKSAEGEDEVVAMEEEKADQFPVLDFILEGMWYMYQVMTAGCLRGAVEEDSTRWLSDAFYYFRNDFTEMFREWWIKPGTTNYGLIFGDMDLYENLYNLRACANAAFQYLKIQDRFLVRPVHMSNTEFLMQNLNERIGVFLNPN